MSLFLTYTGTEITNGNWWKPLAIEKKNWLEKFLLLEKKQFEMNTK